MFKFRGLKPLLLLFWSPHPDLNRGPLPYQGSALPLSYVGNSIITSFHMERVMGLEPTSSAWKAEVLPLNYTRLNLIVSLLNHDTFI